MQNLSQRQILSEREAIQQDIIDLLAETESDFELEDVLDAIYQEDDNDDMSTILAMFDRGGDVSELSNILETITDAWNYFPHKSLDGLSPMEKALEY
ncbi:MAG: hypothetical protein M0Q93_02170 [Terrimicrobiaceae bacterium]|nr:hypothetical protein [Terrimicrobiaceae bacterium]